MPNSRWRRLGLVAGAWITAVTFVSVVNSQIPALIDHKCYDEICSVGWVEGTYVCTFAGQQQGCVVCGSSARKETCFTQDAKCCKRASLTPHDCGPKVWGTCVLINGRLECKDLGGGFVGGNCQITSCSTLLGDQCPGGGQE